jgi:hypothetical protein
MPDVQLIINLAGSAFAADLGDLRPWRPLLDNAESIALAQNGKERVRVELGGLRRWVAFERKVGGSPLVCLGYQETVGAVRRAGAVIGGSNRKCLAWLHPGGRVFIGDVPGG